MTVDIMHAIKLTFLNNTRLALSPSHARGQPRFYPAPLTTYMYNKNTPLSISFRSIDFNPQISILQAAATVQ